MHELIGSCYIDVTGTVVQENTHLQGAVDRLVASHALHGSESLCKLLRYLAKRAHDQPGIQVKEYQIATEVFGRQSDFDPQLDSFVRVQAGRLRAKLSEYYNSEGTVDPIVVELPKGSYALAVHERVNFSGANGVAPDSHTRPSASLLPVASGNKSLMALLGMSLFAALCVIAWLLATRTNSARTVQADPTATAAPNIRLFWKGFLKEDQEPWVIFSNAAFVGRPDIGMRYFNAAKDHNVHILDHYTGVGEVLAVHNLDLVFEALHLSARIKRGSLFSLDDAKNNNLILIGSPSENLTLLEVPSTTEFVFKQVSSGPRAGNVEIINVHPQGKEHAEYLASPSDVPLTDDYAVVALVRGINPQNYELILAGTSTMGTQAAVEYVTRPNYLSELLQHLNVSSPGDLKPFEALIHAKVAKGVPVEPSLVALRITNQ
jgi:hypothetical protein